MQKSDTVSASKVASGTWSGSKTRFGLTGQLSSSKTGLHKVRLGVGEAFGATLLEDPVGIGAGAAAAAVTTRGWAALHFSIKL